MWRFSLTSLQTLIAQALSTSEQVINVRQGNSGEAVTGSPFISVSILESLSPGLPQRTQIDDQHELVTEDRIATVRVQAYGAGAMNILFRFRAWLGSSPGMLALKDIGTACPSVDEPKDVSAAVASGREERAVMNLTLTWADKYQIEQAIIAEVPVDIFTDNPPAEIHFTVKA